MIDDPGTEASFRDMLEVLFLTPEQRTYAVFHSRAEELAESLPNHSVDLILTDPPYFRVKSEAWDRQWKSDKEYLIWMEGLCRQWARILKPNGSLYVFASPDMAARIECVMRERFHVLNRIRWIKESGWHRKAKKEELRSFLPPWEEIIFAEPFDSDVEVDRRIGYELACSALHKKVYAPIGSYLKQERERAGLTRNEVEVALGFVSSDDPTRGTALCYRWEEGSSLPQREDYYRLRDLLNKRGGEFLRKEYEDLRKEYEDLRRPFFLFPDMLSIDIWNFPPVFSSPYKHPCEKPIALLEFIIRCSSRPGDLVADFFAGLAQQEQPLFATGEGFTVVIKTQHGPREPYHG